MAKRWPSYLLYALPAVPLAALYLPLYSFVTPFYAAERGVDLAALGAAWIAIRLFDAVSDPAAGWLSDRTAGVIGRRGWLVLAAPVIMLATWQAFVPPEEAGLSHAVIWLFVLTLGWTLAQTPYAAWGAELETSYAGRTRVTAWREAMVLVGTVLTTVLYAAGGEGGSGLLWVAVAVLCLLPLTVGAAAFGLREGAGRAQARVGFRQGARAMRENRPFRILLGAWFVNGLANGLPVTLFLFYVAHRLEAPEAIAWLFPLYFLAAIAGLPFWSWAARRTSKHGAWSAAMLFASAVFAVALFLGPGDVAAFGVVTLLTGLAFGADLALPPAMQADVVELDTQATGARRAGLFFAIWQVATKAALAVSSGAALIVLASAGFDAEAVPGPGANGETALTALAILYAGVPIALKLAAVALLRGFRLDAAALDRLRAA